MSRGRPSRQREPTIALINIVFLMLIFFLVAGTIAQPVGRKVELVETALLDGAPPVDALVVHADGQMAYRGRQVFDVASFLAGLPAATRSTVRLVPDRSLAAQRLIALGRDLREAGATRITIVAERVTE